MKNTILGKHYAGSIAYGTNHEHSDIDFRGIFAADKLALLSPFETIKEITDEKEEDTKFYELRTYFDLVSKMNPNIIETLWVDPSHIVLDTDPYKKLRESRDLFMNQKIAFTTVSMALNKVKSMKNRNKWINKPQPEEAPQQKDFITMLHNFTEEKRFSLDLEECKENYRLQPYDKNILAVIKNEGSKPFNHLGHLNIKYDKEIARKQPDYLIKFNKEEYENAKVNHKQYWEWINKRNEKRSVLEEKYGFDTKDAMHLVRVLRVGEEALKTGVVKVKRDDAEELKSILNGSWSYEKLLKYAEDKNKSLESLLKKTDLPPQPNYEKLTELLGEMYEMSWRLNPTSENTIASPEKKRSSTLSRRRP